MTDLDYTYNLIWRHFLIYKHALSASPDWRCPAFFIAPGHGRIFCLTLKRYTGICLIKAIRIANGQMVDVGDILAFSYTGRLYIVANLFSGAVHAPPGNVTHFFEETFDVSPSDIASFACKIVDITSAGVENEVCTVEHKQLVPTGRLHAFLRQHAAMIFNELESAHRCYVVAGYEKHGSRYVNLSGLSMKRQSPAT